MVISHQKPALCIVFQFLLFLFLRHQESLAASQIYFGDFFPGSFAYRNIIGF